jgi:hypothetical protein
MNENVMHQAVLNLQREPIDRRVPLIAGFGIDIVGCKDEFLTQGSVIDIQ